VISSLLRIAALLCSAVLIFSFVAFASDQAGKSSKETVAKIATADSADNPANQRALIANVNQASPSATTERVREKQHGALREHLDDANDVLVSPFGGIISSSSIWAQRIVTGLLALLVFGLGLGFLGRYASSRGV
jgi:hypothetical protein